MPTALRTVRTPTVLRGVPYETYALIRDHARNAGYRMTYHDGTLEIMSPEFRHDKAGGRLAMIVRAYAAVFGVAVAMLAAFEPARLASRISIVRAVQFE